MLPQYGALILKRTLTSLRWYSAGQLGGRKINNYSTYASVTEMITNLGWRSLQDRRSDARLCLFFKIFHGLVAVPLPSFVRHPMRIPRHSHDLYISQIQTRTDYYKYSFFPLAIVQWNRLPSEVALLPTLPRFRLAVSAISHLMP